MVGALHRAQVGGVHIRQCGVESRVDEEHLGTLDLPFREIAGSRRQTVDKEQGF